MSPEKPMPATIRPAGRRMKRKTLFIIATSVSMLVYLVLLPLSQMQPWLVWPALTAALLGIVFAGFWMSSIDEAAQQAHYIAWFWGGSVGLLVSMLVFVTAVLRPETFAPVLSMLGASRTFAAGIAVGIIPPVLIYAVWWAVLWLRRG